MTIKGFLSRSKWPAATVGLTLGAILGATGLLSTAIAVHGPTFPFEVDGDPTQTTAQDDWDTVFDIAGPPYSTPRETPVFGGNSTFVTDGANLAGGKETSAWSGSNKDIDLISTWEYKSAKVTPDKDNITNAYAKAYPVEGFAANDLPGHPSVTHSHLIIYFGADRFSNNGDAALGFWFFQSDVGLGPQGAFSGEHQIGDVLVQVDFVSGGRSSEVQIFKWVGSGGSHGALDEIVPATGSNGTEVCTANDTACAVTNDHAIPSPWAYTPKSGSAGSFPSESFYEAGIDITALVGEVCFSSFMAETRTSHSETAELADFALGDFDLCSVNVEKVCNTQDGVSPVFDPADESYQTKHTVTVTNDGFGAIHDVELRDTKVDALNVCSIASISSEGLAGAVGDVFPDSATFLPIADQLDPGESVTLALLCVADDASDNKNPFTNGVEVRSSSSAGGAQTITDLDTEVASENDADGLDACTLTLEVGLNLEKFCQGDEDSPLFQAGDKSVVLDPNNGYAPQVCVDVFISNTQDTQKMVVDTFTDSDLGNLLPAGGLTLEPEGTDGDSYAVSRCYTPTAPDNGATDPGQVTYSDTVNASGHGKNQPLTVEASPKTATCKLCPSCPDCPPSG